MKNEPKAATSGLKAVGMIALLASLLPLLMPAASAVSYSMTAEVDASQATAYVGDEVVFTYLITNTGDNTLYNVFLDATRGDDFLIGNLESGESAEVEGYYIISEVDVQDQGGLGYVFNDAIATAENSRGRTILTSYAAVGILILE